jgi:phosphoribosylamine--glycine ligase/phosphoribosylaminoimidazole synthetase
MTVLLVGSGAREHALAMAIGASSECERLVIAPGNAGMAEVGDIAEVALDDIDGLCALAERISADLVVIGPEAPLAAGLADRLRGREMLCFGPSAAAARIESSKAFSKSFMQRHGIPTAAGRSFTDAGSAKKWAREFGRPVVVKASALAAGKGVIVPESAHQTEEAIETLLVPGGEIVLEERLEGEELSLIALCDGKNYAVLPSARDHKRLLEGDRGPNTGGMGAYAPACSMEEAEALARLVIAPALGGLAEEGSPFVGALYAGLMLTEGGPRVLEYNARFGDPETQAILPLFASDLLATLAACARGDIGQALPRFYRQSAACVVLASEGYPVHPKTGRAIDIGALPEKAFCLHAGTRLESGQIVSAGGRVLSVVGMDATREEALKTAYEAVANIHFEGMQYRRDIGARAARVAEFVRTSLAAVSAPAGAGAPGTAAPQPAPSAYVRAGVDIDAGNKAVELMKKTVRSTYGSEVIAGIGAFGGQYDASSFKTLGSPVLVASTDGVGTKTSLALKLGRLKGLGQDMVNHSIDDILVQGARPLFFMDYIAADALDPEKVAEIVDGMAEACRDANCALLGGETAEMPGTYRHGEMDIAGTIVGLADRQSLLPRPDIAEGDILIGLPSSGLHTNGYSLARAITAEMDLGRVQPELGEALADALLRPHRSYLPILRNALDATPGPVKALAHITGGGLVENISRVLPPSLDARIHAESWKWPPLFSLLQRWGNISTEEMRRVFNLGIGMVAIVSAGERARFLSMLAEPASVIGELVPGCGKVRFV